MCVTIMKMPYKPAAGGGNGEREKHNYITSVTTSQIKIQQFQTVTDLPFSFYSYSYILNC